MRVKYKRTEYKIEADRYQYILSKRIKDNEQGQEQFEPLGYYQDLYFLFKVLVRMGAIAAKDANDFIESMSSTLRSLAETVKEVIKNETHT